jgi:lysine/ornithine N-monooxygenase
MTDMLKGSQVLQKTYTYIENVTKESRKALMEEFSQNHKGIALNSASDALRQSVLDWFPRRDPMLRLVHEKTSQGKPGDVRMDFRGETKTVHFKVHLHAVFAVTGQSPDSPSFLKEVNLTVDPREFSM